MTSTIATLGEVGTFIAGSGFPLHFQGQTSGSYPFAKVGDISRCARAGRQELGDADHWVDDDIVSQLKAKIVPARAILFAKIGEAIQQNFRVIASRPMLVDNNAMAYVAADDRLDHRYAFHFLKSIDMYRLASSTTVPSLRKSTLEEIVVPLPPLPEQRRIAAILDKADALRAKRRVAIAKLDQLLQSVFLDMFGDPVTNPKGWPMRPFTEVGVWTSGATPSKSESRYWDGAIPWVSPKDMKRALIDDAEDHVSEAAFTESNLKRVPPGHLLIVVRGMILAHSFPTAINSVAIAINQDMKAIRPSSGFDVVYLKAAVDALKARILGVVSTAGHGTRRLDTRDASDVLVPKPPAHLQDSFRRIVELNRRLFANAHSQKNAEEKLLSALQHQAFSGVLSP